MASRVTKSKSFDLKMSKKVAELTQVVHMLFMRNHEREVEVQLTKDLYNLELDRLHKKYQNQIGQTEGKLNSEIEKLKVANGAVTEEAIKQKIASAVNETENSWRKRYDQKEAQYIKERGDNVGLRDALTVAQEELDKVRANSANASKEVTSQLSDKDSEIQQLRKQCSLYDRRLKEQDKLFQTISEGLKETLQKQQDEVRQLRSMLDESQMNEDQTSNKNKQLENEIKTLRRDLSRRSTEISTLRRASATASPILPALPHEVYDELDHLRKLVQKYRLELSNREGNFNRMFTDKSPVHVDQRSLRSLTTLPGRTATKEKSFSYASSQGYEQINEEGRAVSSSKNARSPLRRVIPARSSVLNSYNKQNNERHYAS